jgi:hypothetical protein
MAEKRLGAGRLSFRERISLYLALEEILGIGEKRSVLNSLRARAGKEEEFRSNCGVEPQGGIGTGKLAVLECRCGRPEAERVLRCWDGLCRKVGA